MPEPVTLVGRQSVMSDLRHWLARNSGGGSLVIEGPAGIGKSRLLSAAMVEARAMGLAVATGRATELDRFAPMTTLMTALKNTEPEPIDVSHLVGQESSRFWLVDRLGEAIEEYIRSRPLVVALDDAHWTDELSALALLLLVPALAGAPVQWLVTRRSTRDNSSGQAAINSLVNEGAEVIHLDPLPDEALAELCASALHAKPDATVLTLAARSGGNPLLLGQLISTLRDAGQLLISDGIATVIAHELPSSFLSTVKLRLGGMMVETQGLLDAASVLGRPFTLHHVAEILGRTPVQLVQAADEATAAGLLVESGAELAFGHDLIREAVYNNLSGPVRSVLHGAAATVTLTHGLSSVEIAEHLVRSGKPANEKMIGELRAAAAQIAPSAPGTAADLLLQALRLVGEQNPFRPALVAEAVRLLSAAGRLTAARSLAENALGNGLDPQEEAAIRLGLAEALKHAGLNAEVVECAGRGLAIAGISRAHRAQLLATQAHGLLYVNDIEGAELAASEAVRLGTAAGEQSAVVFGKVACSVAARARANLEGALAHAREAVELAERAGGDAQHRHPRLWLARALVTVDRFDEADAMYAAGHREADRLGTAWSQPLWHFYRAELHLAAGRLTDAQAEAEAGVRVAERLAALQLSVPLLALLARISLQRDEISEAHEHVRRTQPLVAQGISVGPGDLTLAVALLQEASHQPRAALEALAEVYQGTPCALLLLSTDPGAAATLVRIAMKAGAPAEAQAIVAAAGQLADRNPTITSAVGAALHAEGLLAADLELLRSAVTRLGSSCRPLALAAALEDLAVVEYAAGNHQLTVAALDEALQLWSACEAKRDANRVHQRLLRFSTQERQVTASQPAPSTAWSTLTTSELRVIRLVTLGLTNRETADRLYLSPHTVDSHLRHTFTKLGVNSRVELTRLSLEYGSIEPRTA